MIAENIITEDVWKNYGKNKDVKIRNYIFEQYYCTVTSIVNKTCTGKPYTDEREDILNYLSIVLLKLIERFDWTKGVKFDTYISPRLHGAVTDYMRQRFGSRRKETKKPVEIISIDTLLSDEEHDGFTAMDIDSGVDTEAIYERQELTAEMYRALKYLTEQEREVIVSRYLQDVRQYEVAVRMGISEGRVSQINTVALKKLKKYIKV